MGARPSISRWLLTMGHHGTSGRNHHSNMRCLINRIYKSFLFTGESESGNPTLKPILSFILLWLPPCHKIVTKEGKYDSSCDLWSCGVIMYTMLWSLDQKGKQRRQKSHPRFAERLATRFAERSNQWRWFLKCMCIHSAYVNRNYIILCLKAIGRCIPHLTHWRWLSTFLWQDGPGSSEQSAKGHLSIWTKVLETYLPGCQEVDWHAIEIWARATVPWLWFEGWGEEWVVAELLWGTLLGFQYCLGKWDWTTCVRYVPRQVWACLLYVLQYEVLANVRIWNT